MSMQFLKPAGRRLMTSRTDTAVNRKGKILDLQDLDTEIFSQPEGICFSPSGDLFISNEGKGRKGYILKFGLHNKE